MTTREAAAMYEAQHVMSVSGRRDAIYNPHGKPVSDLPVIYGFNNGGSRDWLNACAIAADGTVLGGHICSSEAYIPHDLGVLEGTRSDRHAKYREHYPDGYRMEFVPYREMYAHAGLMRAIELNKANAPQQA